MSLISLLFNQLNIPLATHKTVGPDTCLEYLGIVLDTKNMEARLPENKVLRICDFFNSFKDKKSCTKRQLLSLLGHLNFATRIIRPGRSFVSHFISLSTTVKELHHYVKLDAEVRLDIDMWQKFLSNWNRVSFFLNDNITNSADMHLYTDSTDKAFAGIYYHKWFQSEFPPNLISEDMALLELYPIIVACVLWGNKWNRKRILFHCDNMSTVQIINKGRSKVKVIMKLLRRLTWCAAKHNFTVHAQHVPGKLNSVADALSRFQMETFRKLAPKADTRPTPCLPLKELLMIQSILKKICGSML